MKFILIASGVVLTLISLVYFFRLIFYIGNSYQITDFGYGILVGKTIFMIVGILLIYFGIRKKKYKP